MPIGIDDNHTNALTDLIDKSIEIGLKFNFEYQGKKNHRIFKRNIYNYDGGLRTVKKGRI